MERPLKKARLEQREFILGHYKTGMTNVKQLRELLKENFSNHPRILSVSAISAWLLRYKNGTTDVSDRPRSGRPLGASDERVSQLIQLNPYMSVTDLYIDLDAPRRAVKSSIVRAGFVNNHMMWVQKEPSEELLNSRIEFCRILIERLEEDSFLDRVIFEGERTITYNKYKQHFKTKNAKNVLKPTEELIAKSGLKPHKIVLHLWWTRQGLITYKLVGPNMLSNEFYLQELDEVHKEVENNCFCSEELPFILYHNSDKYLSREVNRRVHAFGWEQMVHPHQCPDISPTDYMVLAKFQQAFNTTIYTQLDQVQDFVYKYFDTRKGKFYADAVDIWPEKWHRIIETEGKYIATNDVLV